MLRMLFLCSIRARISSARGEGGEGGGGRSGERAVQPACLQGLTLLQNNAARGRCPLCQVS